MIEGHELENRKAEPRGAEAIKADVRRVGAKREESAPVGLSLAQRVARAAAVLPGGEAVHCGHCFGMGRDAAIREIEAAS